MHKNRTFCELEFIHITKYGRKQKFFVLDIQAKSQRRFLLLIYKYRKRKCFIIDLWEQKWERNNLKKICRLVYLTMGF